MKTLTEILQQPPVFLHGWQKKADVNRDFIGWDKGEQPLPGWDKTNILFASYGQDNYSGDAWVLFEKEGKLYEVNGSHCSCYGLEDQWEPEETTLESIHHRLKEGYLGKDDWSGNEFAAELGKFLGTSE